MRYLQIILNMRFCKLKQSLLFLSGIFSYSIVFSLTHISFWHAMSGQAGSAVNQIVQDFNLSQKEYQLDAYYKGNYPETLTNLVAAFRAGESPTIAQVFEVGSATMIEPPGIIKPVQSLFASHQKSLDDILPVIKTYYSDSQGQLLAFPFNVSTPVLYYNKRLFKKAHVAEAPFDWGMMKDVAKQLKTKKIKGFSTTWPSWILFENYTASAKIPFASDHNGFSSDAPTLIYDTEAFMHFLADLLDWQREGFYQYGGREDDAVALFTSERVAMLLHSSGSVASMPSVVNFPVGIAPLPKVKGISGSVLIGGAALWVMQKHSQEEYAGTYAFFKFLLQPETQEKWQALTGYLPITRAAVSRARAGGFYKTHPDLWVATSQVLAIKKSDTIGLRLGNYHLIRKINLDALESILMGRQSVKDAIRFAVSQGNRVLKQFSNNVSIKKKGNS